MVLALSVLVCPIFGQSQDPPKLFSTALSLRGYSLPINANQTFQTNSTKQITASKDGLLEVALRHTSESRRRESIAWVLSKRPVAQEGLLATFLKPSPSRLLNLITPMEISSSDNGNAMINRGRFNSGMRPMPRTFQDAKNHEPEGFLLITK